MITAGGAGGSGHIGALPLLPGPSPAAPTALQRQRLITLHGNNGQPIKVLVLVLEGRSPFLPCCFSVLADRWMALPWPPVCGNLRSGRFPSVLILATSSSGEGKTRPLNSADNGRPPLDPPPPVTELSDGRSEATRRWWHQSALNHFTAAILLINASPTSTKRRCLLIT